MANWAMDAATELMQAKCKRMNFPNTIEGWVTHTANMPLVSRCVAFSTNEHSRRFDENANNDMTCDGAVDGAVDGVVDGSSSDKNSNKKASTELSRAQE